MLRGRLYQSTLFGIRVGEQNAGSILRILLGASLPIPLMVMVIFIVCDLFHFNKDSDYERLADSSVEFIALGFVWYSVLGLLYFGIPCLIYSVLLEWRKRTGKRCLPVSLGLGAFFGLGIGYSFLPPLDRCGALHYAEGLVHFIGVTLMFWLLVPRMLGCIHNRKSDSDKAATPSTV